MNLMGTLAKVAMGYATARGVDAMSGAQGVPKMLGGAQVPATDAKAPQMPGMDQLQGMMSQMGGGADMDGLQDMMAKMTGGAGGMQDIMAKMSESGFDLSALMGGGGSDDADKSGLLSSTPGGGAGMAGMLAAVGGAAATSGQGVGGLLDQFNAKDTAPDAEAAAGLMLRAMIQAAKSDGGIDKAEKAKILETVGDDADAEDIAFIRDQLAAPVDVDALAADTPAAQAMQVYSMSLMSIRVDSAAEARYLDTLAHALDLNQQTVNGLHLQMGVQPLYS
jgi:uncharacterized membrane protein YebE (DUF533 family)